MTALSNLNQFDVSPRPSTEDGGFLDAAEFLYVAADRPPKIFLSSLVQ